MLNGTQGSWSAHLLIWLAVGKRSCSLSWKVATDFALKKKKKKVKSDQLKSITPEKWETSLRIYPVSNFNFSAAAWSMTFIKKLNFTKQSWQTVNSVCCVCMSSDHHLTHEGFFLSDINTFSLFASSVWHCLHSNQFLWGGGIQFSLTYH